MATAFEMQTKARDISQACWRLQEMLTGKQIYIFFSSNPDLTQQLLTETAGLLTRTIVLFGLQEYFVSKGLSSNELPNKADLELGRSPDWLSPGDVVIGLSGYTCDVPTQTGVVDYGPREIVNYDAAGYTWKYLLDETETVHDPVRLDRFFRDRGWIKIELSASDRAGQIDEISAMYDTELAGLNSKIDYFDSRAFLNA